MNILIAFRKCFWIPGFEAKCLCFPVVFIFVGTCNECLLPSQKRNLLSFIPVLWDFCSRLLVNMIESFQFTTKITVLKWRWIFEDDRKGGVYENFHVPRHAGATPGPKTPDSCSSYMCLYVKKIWDRKNFFFMVESHFEEKKSVILGKILL